MELDDFKTHTGNGVMVSCGELNIHKRIEECLVFCRDKRRVYQSYKDLALDFGINGTKKFFPLPLFLGIIAEDNRFMPYLAEFRGYGG